MIEFRLFLAVLFMSLPVSLAAQHQLPAGIWTNTEDEYFAEDEGREKPEWIAIRVAPDGKWQRIDAFGKPIAMDAAKWSDAPIPSLNRNNDGVWYVGKSELRRAREFRCWVSVRKFAGKPDGSPDWTFHNNLSVFDQGGRVFVPGGGEAPDVTFRMRNVTWAKGSRNAPSLVLYAHKNNPVRAESYSWAGPDSERVGINLRWVQGSCAQDYDAQGANEDALIAAGERWQRFYEAGDWTALQKLYTDDAVLMTQGQPKIEGADNIILFLQRISQAGGSVRFRFEPEEVFVEQPFGYVTSRYRMDISFPGGDAVAPAVGRSYLVYKWQGGDWKLWRDMDNTAPDVTAEDFDQ